MKNVKGISGNTNATFKGMVRWPIEDDQGYLHHFILPNRYYIKTVHTHILFPQHLAQQSSDHHPQPEGTRSTTTSSNITLFWNQHKFTKTVNLDPKLNIAMMQTAPGTKTFHAHMAQKL